MLLKIVLPTYVGVGKGPEIDLYKKMGSNKSWRKPVPNADSTSAAR